ncbi:hypothetical protein HHI36_013137 [Cryptolaemus montrouzieri]|uniref:Uncharacterized protein n=1 Tax=Cryptolaemus montrouzieri TaxID=559131 RepID=A0ABD2NGV0_9CUCU
MRDMERLALKTFQIGLLKPHRNLLSNFKPNSIKDCINKCQFHDNRKQEWFTSYNNYRKNPENFTNKLNSSNNQGFANSVKKPLPSKKESIRNKTWLQFYKDKSNQPTPLSTSTIVPQQHDENLSDENLYDENLYDENLYDENNETGENFWSTALESQQR